MKTGKDKYFIHAAIRIILLFPFILSTTVSFAQQTLVDSFKHLISITKDDTLKINLLENLGQAYRDAKKIDSSILSYKQALKLNEIITYSVLRQCNNMATIDYLLYITGNYAGSLAYASRALALSEKIKDVSQTGHAHLVIGHNYKALGEYRKALDHYLKAKQIFKLYYLKQGQMEKNTYTIQCIGDLYLKLNQPDSALLFTQQAYSLAKAKSEYGLMLYSLRIFGDIYLAKGNDQLALNYCRQYISGFYTHKENNRDVGFVYLNLSRIFQKNGQIDSAILYAKKALNNAEDYHDQENIFNAATVLYNFYDDNSKYKKIQHTKDSIIGINKLRHSYFITNNKVAKIKTDRLKKQLTLATTDSVKIGLLNQIGQEYINAAKVDSSIHFYQQALELIKKNKLPLIREIWQLATLGYVSSITGNYSMSMQYANSALQLSEQTNNNEQIAYALTNIAAAHAGMGDLRKSLNYYFKAKKAFEKYESGHWAIQNIAETYLKMHILDSALYFNRKAYFIADTGHNQQYMKAFAIRIFANIYVEKGEDHLALKYYRQFIDAFYNYNLNNREIAHAYFGMAKLYHRMKQIDSSIYYADKALAAAQIYADAEHVFNASKFLYFLHDSLHNESESFKYFKIAAVAKDSLINLEKMRQIQMLTFNEQVREKQQQVTETKETARIRLIIIIVSILIFILSFLLWNRIRQLRLKHKMILEQKEAEKLKAIDKMKDRFFSNITHELRTPLSLILSPVELYLQHPEQLKNPSALFESIYKNSSYLLSLINQLLDISKLDGGSMSINLSQGYFGNYIGELMEGFEENAGRKQLTLHFENSTNGKYLFDPQHWKKIINNLVSNAIKFTPTGGNICVSVDKIAGLQSKDIILLTVKDTGIGIHKDHLPFITDRFYQADNSLVRKYEGAGIGLALLSELVKLMGGKLEIDSEESKGSVFSITTTLESAEGKKSYPELTNLRKSILFSDLHPVQSNGISKENIPVILIVEDNVELRNFMQRSIEPVYKVITAAHGEDGLQIASSQFPDIIISDVMMPVMDGFELCSRIKNDPATSHIAFIMLSAKANHESKMTGLDKGADDYLTKPFSVDELLSRIKNHLIRQHKLRDYNLQQLMLENPLPAFTEVQNGFLQDIHKSIKNNLDDEHLTVEFMATKMALTEDTLNRKLVTNIGLSANELIKQYHLKKAEMQKKMVELEAKALRAQMNPHFIFNCLNSIKSLINKNENDKAAGYLTTFSKLIRTLFQNSDKREVSLFEEIENCKLYTELEKMRFGDKVEFIFNVDETIDLKDIKIPALILQPFIENAIWHGLVPLEAGGRVVVSVNENDGAVQCIIDDDGIGRELSKQYKAQYETSHQSKGITMTQSRLELDKLLNEREEYIEIIDKKSEAGIAEGTTIIITIKQTKN